MNYSDRDNGALSRLAIALALSFTNRSVDRLCAFLFLHISRAISFYPLLSLPIFLRTFLVNPHLFFPSLPPSNLPLFSLLRVTRKVMEFLQPLIVRYNDEGIALRQFQIGSWVIFKPARPDSDRNCNQSGSILDICLAKRGSD